MADTNEPVNNPAGAESGLNAGLGMSEKEKDEFLELAKKLTPKSWPFSPDWDRCKNAAYCEKDGLKDEILRLRQFLETIRDAGLTAAEAAQHASDALMPNVELTGRAKTPGTKT